MSEYKQLLLMEEPTNGLLDMGGEGETMSTSYEYLLKHASYKPNLGCVVPMQAISRNSLTNGRTLTFMWLRSCVLGEVTCL